MMFSRFLSLLLLSLLIFFSSFSNASVVGTSASLPFTALGMANGVSSPGLYYFNISGTTFSSYVNTGNSGGWVQVALDYGNGSGSLPQVESLPGAPGARGILTPTILAGFTGLTQIRLLSTGATPSLDVVSSNSTLLGYIAANRTINSGLDDSPYEIWSGTGSTYVSPSGVVCNTAQGLALQVNIFHPCGKADGFHWMPALGIQAVSFTAGEIPNSASLQLFAKAASVPIPPTVTLTKISNGGVGSFNFTGTNGFTNQTITTSAQGVGVSGATQILTTVGAATTITESIPSGYVLTNINCTGLGSGGGFTPNLSAGSVTLNAAATAAGSDISCSFTNTLLPTVTLSKTSLGDVGSFDFTGTNGFGSETLTTTSTNTPVSGSARALTSTATATTITETIPSGYTVSNISCTGLGAGGTATPNLSAGSVVLDAAATAAGSNISCSFTNTLLPTVTLSKTSLGAVGSFDFTGTNGFGSETLTTTSTNTPVSGSARALTNAATATTITETIPSGYTVSNISCTGLGAGGTATPNLSAGSIVLDAAATAAGSNINCSFTNLFSNPSLSLVKSTTVTQYGALGESIPYTYLVTNNGNVTLNNIAVTDDKISAVVCPVTTLTAGQSVICTGTYIITQVDLDVGQLTNTAYASSGSTFSLTDTLTIHAAQSPQLVLVKSSSNTGFTQEGESIIYNYQVTNNGNITLTNQILVSDDKVASVVCPSLPGGGLHPSGSISCTGTYLVTQADIDSKEIVNTAYATSGAIISPTVSLTLPFISSSGSVSLVKTANLTAFSLPGTQIQYTYTVTNTGQSSLSNIKLMDSKIGEIICPETALAQNSFMTCTASYISTLDDVKDGGITNIAIVSAMALSQQVSAQASLHIALDSEYIRQQTLDSIKNFIGDRAKLIISNQPNPHRRIERLQSETQIYKGQNSSIHPNTNGADAHFELTAQDLGIEFEKLDFWSEIRAAYLTSNPFEFSRHTEYGIASLGVDYLMTKRLLLGWSTQFDLINQTGAQSNATNAKGNGWLLGPYASYLVSPNVYLHSSMAFGGSNNQMNIFDLYEDVFTTQRSLYNAALVGFWNYNNWSYSPTIGFTYYQETQPQFLNTVNIIIPKQRIYEGQANIGPEIGYTFKKGSAQEVAIALSLQGLYNFTNSAIQVLDDPMGFFNAFSTRIQFMTSVKLSSGIFLSPIIQLEGLGGNIYKSYQGSILISMPFG